MTAPILDAYAIQRIDQMTAAGRSVRFMADNLGWREATLKQILDGRSPSKAPAVLPGSFQTAVEPQAYHRPRNGPARVLTALRCGPAGTAELAARLNMGGRHRQAAIGASLRRLEQRGLVSCSASGGRFVWSLTAEGRGHP